MCVPLFAGTAMYVRLLIVNDNVEILRVNRRCDEIGLGTERSWLLFFQVNRVVVNDLRPVQRNVQ